MSSKAIDSFGGEPKVLLLRFSSLGDIVLSLPVVDSLKQAVPGAHVTYATKSCYAPLLAGNTGIDRILALGEGGEGTGLPALFRLCRRAGNVDLIIDLHGNLRSRMCRFFVGAPAVTGGRDALKRRLAARGISAGGGIRHVVDRYLEALGKVGVEGQVRTPRIELTDSEREGAARFLSSAGVRDPRQTAVIAPGAKWPNKAWTARGFAQVARMLDEQRGLQTVIVGGDSESETARNLAQLSDTQMVDITGRTGLRELAAVLSLAAVFIGNDSGPGHMAAAVGTAAVVLFGPTSEAFGFTPLGRYVRTVSLPLDCRPCSIHGGTVCPEGARRCLDDMEPETIFQAAVELLDAKAKGSRDGKGSMLS